MRKKKPLKIPESEQRVRLRAGHGPWRGSFRAVSEPYTEDESGEVVIRVARENEYRNAMGESRHAVGISWPARQMEVVRLPEDVIHVIQEPSERLFTQEEAEHRGFWSRLFGG